VAHQVPSARTLAAKMRTELKDQLDAADSEPTPEQRVRRKFRAIAAALKSAWKQA
jgi:hypothetical protein